MERKVIHRYVSREVLCMHVNKIFIHTVCVGGTNISATRPCTASQHKMVGVPRTHFCTTNMAAKKAKKAVKKAAKKAVKKTVKKAAKKAPKKAAKKAAKKASKKR